MLQNDEKRIAEKVSRCWRFSRFFFHSRWINLQFRILFKGLHCAHGTKKRIWNKFSKLLILCAGNTHTHTRARITIEFSKSIGWVEKLSCATCAQLNFHTNTHIYTALDNFCGFNKVLIFQNNNFL